MHVSVLDPTVLKSRNFYIVGTMSTGEAVEDHQSSTKSYVDAAVDGIENDIHHEDYITEDTVKHVALEPPLNPTPGKQQNPNSSQTNGSAAQQTASSEVVVERYRDKDGEHLVSFRPQWDNKTNKPLAVKRRNSELLSGRKAGARWDRRQAAKYVSQHYLTD